MKLSLKSVAMALAVASLGTVAFASEKAKPADAKHTMEKTGEMKGMTITGKVVSCSTESNSCKISETTKAADGKETTKETEVWWSDTTKLAWKNEKMTAATTTDLKAGTEVTIKYEHNKDHKAVATEIWLHPAMATGAATMPTTEKK